jgi:hypothetical protein
METPDGRWHLGIGDPTPLGWITVGAYAAAALLCWWRHARVRGQGGDASRFWFWLAVMLALLGLNKELDLQSAFTAVGRWLALAQGWYPQRHLLQVVFIGVLILAGALWLGGMKRMAWPPSAGRSLALIGLVSLVVFVLARAASFHHVDLLLGSTALGLRWNVILELGGVSCVALGALVDARAPG